MKIDQGTRDFTFCRSIAAHIEALSQYREVDQGGDDPNIYGKFKMEKLANRTTRDLNTFCKFKRLKGQLGFPVSDKKSSLPVSWDPPSVTKNHHFQNLEPPREAEDRRRRTDDGRRMTDDKAGQDQSELSVGGTKRDVENTPNVPASTVSWPAYPV